MRKPKITREQIMEATIALTAQNGLENLTTKKVALALTISEGSVLYYYPNKKNLLMQTMLYIDKQIDTVLKGQAYADENTIEAVPKLWFSYFLFFLERPGYAKYYRSARYSSYFNQEIMKKQQEAFPFFTDFMKKNAFLLQLNVEIFWIYVIETTLNFAVRMGEGGISPTHENITCVFNMISYGISGLFQKEQEKLFAAGQIPIPGDNPDGSKTENGAR